MEMPYASFSLLAIALFALSVTVCEILKVEMCMTLTLTIRVGQVKCQYVNRNATCDILRDNNV